MRPYVTRGGIASVEMEEHRSGGVVHYVDHLAALESARAEAFRMGQEEMREEAVRAAACPHCNGTGSYAVGHCDENGNTEMEERQCCYPQDHAAMIDRILAIPLKDKP